MAKAVCGYNNRDFLLEVNKFKGTLVTCGEHTLHPSLSKHIFISVQLQVSSVFYFPECKSKRIYPRASTTFFIHTTQFNQIQLFMYLFINLSLLFHKILQSKEEKQIKMVHVNLMLRNYKQYAFDIFLVLFYSSK